ncbi:MAG TPA: SCO family protein [Thermoanaerobaculia bacterium]|nr:SCO family protein [Thermoanaerobaculia bacterium]
MSSASVLHRTERTTALVGCILLITIVLASCTRQEPLPRLYPVPDTALVDQDGRDVHLSEYNGYVTVYAFIFTNCAGICPLMTQKMRSIVKEVDPDAPVRFVSISVDPVRDTPEALRAYAERVGRDPRWKFLRGEGDTVIDLSQKGFKLAAGMEIESGAEPILHSPRFVLVDRTGMIRGYYDSLASEDVEKLERHIKALVREV